MAAFLIGQPDPRFEPRPQQVSTAVTHRAGLNQLARYGPPPGGIQPLHDQVHIAGDAPHQLVSDRLNIPRRVVPTADLVPDRHVLAV
jgi:hypothetical protein